MRRQHSDECILLYTADTRKRIRVLLYTRVYTILPRSPTVYSCAIFPQPTTYADPHLWDWDWGSHWEKSITIKHFFLINFKKMIVYNFNEFYDYLLGSEKLHFFFIGRNMKRLARIDKLCDSRHESWQRRRQRFLRISRIICRPWGVIWYNFGVAATYEFRYTDVRKLRRNVTLSAKGQT